MNMEVTVGKLAPLFEAEAFQDEEIKRIKLENYRGKWLVLFFYPADFTFVCPTELGDLAEKYPEFQKLGAEILSISTDSVFVHKAWHDQSELIKKIRFPMVADANEKICRAYGTYLEEEGMSLRGTFLIDPEGKLVSMEMNANGIGRSSKELLRKIKAAQFVHQHGDQVCPANWEPGEKTLHPGLKLVGKI